MFKKIREHLQGSFASLSSDYRVFAEKKIEPKALFSVFRQSSLPAFSYYFLLILSTIISTLGLLINSSATVIGGMIISPLMNPIMTLAYGITAGERRLIERGVGMLLTGIPLVLAVAYFCTAFVNIRVIGSEVLSRAHPNYLDLGLALASGLAGAFAYSRKSIANALPGVAIAVALVPPLCVVGIGSHSGEIGEYMAANVGIDEDMAIGALALFFTNLWGIICAAIVLFLAQGYGNWKKATRGLLACLILLGVATFPLGNTFHKMYIRELFYRELLRFRLDEKRFSEVEIHSVDIRLLRDKYRVYLVLFVNEEKIRDLETTQKNVNAIAARMEKRLNHPVRVEVNIIPLYHVQSEDAPVKAIASDLPALEASEESSD